MLYLGIDQHARQLTISLRDEEGDVLEARQVSTAPPKVNAFFERLTRRRAARNEEFVAVVEEELSNLVFLVDRQAAASCAIPSWKTRPWRTSRSFS